MTLYFITEARFLKSNDGGIYSLGSFTYNLWKRYLTEFDNIVVVARVGLLTDETVNETLLSNGDNVTFMELPYYIGLGGYALKYLKIKKIMSNRFQPNNAYLLRVPGYIGNLARKVLCKKNIPYAVEVVGDPYDVYAPNSPINHPLKPFLRFIGYYGLKDVVKYASASLYVTKYYLQKRYKPAKNTFTTYASNVILKDSFIQSIDSDLNILDANPIKILSIGMLSQMYKCPDIVLETIKLLRENGYNCSLEWLGDGKYRDKMILYAEELGISDYVNFVGLVPAGDKVMEYLRGSHIFVLASQTEGLPRALIEAMACGLFCVSTKVGGIPELLDDEWLAEPKNVESLYYVIQKGLNNPKLVQEQIQKNIKVVLEYKESVLSKKREDFYQYIKNISNDNFDR